MSNYFEELNKINCKDKVEKKGGFSYLSWPFAVGELLKRHPDATWRVFENPEGLPYFLSGSGYYVKVGATVNGIERIQWHPVLNHQNKVVKEPDAFQINTSIQRGLVKAIALHGLGLYIYAGEDLPEGEPTAPITPTAGTFEAMDEGAQAFLQEKANEVISLLNEGDSINAWAHLEAQGFDADEKVAIWNLFDSKQRAALKKAKDAK